MNNVTGAMYMRFGSSKKLYQVSSFEEAARKFAEAQNKAHEMLNFKATSVSILGADFAPVGRISPNGRVWDMNDKIIMERVKI